MIKRSAILLLGLGWILGCATGPKPGTKVTVDMLGGKTVDEQNYLLARKVKVGEIKHRQAGGLNQAQIELISQTDNVVALEVKGSWYDEKGFAISDPKELWRLIIMNPREYKAITFTAPHQNAVKLELTAREGNLEGK